MESSMIKLAKKLLPTLLLTPLLLGTASFSVTDKQGKQAVINVSHLGDNQLMHTSNITIDIQLVHLQDSKGLKYIGGIVPRMSLLNYLSQMRSLIPTDFADYRQYQIERDHGEFHMTLINPYEYKEVDTNKLLTTGSLKITLEGLARVAKGNKETFFVVVNSEQAQMKRQLLGLSAKDFHITLGFKPEDIYDVSKGIERLIKN